MTLLSALLLALAGPVSAKVSYDLTDPALVARVDGKPLSLAALNVLHTVAARKDSKITLAKVVASVVDNRLIGDYAAAHYNEKKLSPNPHIAYRLDVALEDQLAATLRRAYQLDLEDALAKEKGGTLNGALVEPFALNKQQLAAVLGPQQQLRLEYSLTAAQQAAAQKLVLLRYRFANGSRGDITFWDVYRRLNVQGRTMIHGYDLAHLEQQTLQYLATRFTLDWAKRQSGLSAGDLQQLSAAIEDRMRRDAYLQIIGLEADMHYDSAYLKELARKVSNAEVRDYYEKNRQEFKRIDKVRARHIRFANQADADKASQRLSKGEDFASVVGVSVADDRQQGGSLGWIQHGSEIQGWLTQVAYALPVGKVSRPIRSPQLPGQEVVWEIVLVDEKIEGYQPVDSESVRYIASQAIAKKKSVAEFRSLREKLYRDSAIQFNRQHLQQDFTTP